MWYGCGRFRRPVCLAVRRASSKAKRASQVAAAYAVNAKALATQNAYRSDWEDFVGWCRSRGYPELPASAQTVAAYLAALADVAKATTVQRRLSAIRYAHLISGNPTPTTDPYVREVMDGIRRVKGTRVRQAQAATLDPLRAMLATLPNDLGGLRDWALLLVGFAGGFRRAALCALDRADNTFVAEEMDLIIRNDKTDQAGQGREISISYGKHRDACPVRALRVWLQAAGISVGPIFRGVAKGGRTVRQGRLDPGSVVRITKRAAARAGLPDADDSSGHSLRSGLATEAARSGARTMRLWTRLGIRMSAQSSATFVAAAVSPITSSIRSTCERNFGEASPP
jgi:integrase